MKLFSLTILFVGIALLVLSIVTGWIANIIQIVAALHAPITGLFVLKCVGIIVAPLGVVLGWIGLL